MLVWTSAYCLELSVEVVAIQLHVRGKKRYLNKKECLKSGGVQQRHSVGYTYGL